MAATENDIIRDEQERSNLLRAITDVELAMASSTPGTRRVLEITLENAKKRIVVLDKKIEEAKIECQAEEQAQITIAALAAKETALNAREREEYTGFLNEEFFTKKDFGKLAEFYAHTWDRLSEGGKEEMSHRIWEGVRHHEYRFTDLPQIVQEKEEKRLYRKLINADRTQADLKQIPEADRADFIRAYETGKRDEASKVLNRESFRQNVSLKAEMDVKHGSVTTGRAADDLSVLAETPSSPAAAPPESSAMARVKSAAEKLKDLTLDNSPPPPVAASIPNSGVSLVNVRSPA